MHPAYQLALEAQSRSFETLEAARAAVVTSLDAVNAASEAYDLACAALDNAIAGGADGSKQAKLVTEARERFDACVRVMKRREDEVTTAERKHDSARRATDLAEADVRVEADKVLRAEMHDSAERAAVARATWLRNCRECNAASSRAAGRLSQPLPGPHAGYTFLVDGLQDMWRSAGLVSEGDYAGLELDPSAPSLPLNQIPQK